MRWIFPLGAATGLAAALACIGCPGGNGKGGGGGSGTLPLGPTGGGDMKVDLPAIPSKLDVVASAPMDGNSPDKRSPILDIMKAEAERELAALGKMKDPAYFISYQLVEQRVVSIDAEGGALINDSDNTDRNLDVEVRVGSKELDNTRALADDSNALNAPLTRRGVVPFGEDKQAITNALWLETDRRYREAVTAL